MPYFLPNGVHIAKLLEPKEISHKIQVDFESDPMFLQSRPVFDIIIPKQIQVSPPIVGELIRDMASGPWQ
jgi:hypothetical protein